MKTRMFCCKVDKCYKSYRNQEALDNHAKEHVVETYKDPKDFSCSKCGRVLSTKQSLKEHTYTHLQKKLFRCSEIGCGKTFKQSSQLCNHRKVHKEARQMIKSEKFNKLTEDSSSEGFESQDDLEIVGGQIEESFQIPLINILANAMILPNPSSEGKD